MKEAELSAFHLELLAVENVIHIFLKTYSYVAISKMIVAMDCLPARTALMNGYCRSHEACKIINRIWGTLTHQFEVEFP